MTARKDDAGGDGCAAVLRRHGAQIAFRALVADLADRVLRQRRRERAEQIGGGHVDKIGAGRGVGMLELWRKIAKLYT